MRSRGSVWKCQAGLAPSCSSNLAPPAHGQLCHAKLGGEGVIADALCKPADGKRGCNKAAGSSCHQRSSSQSEILSSSWAFFIPALISTFGPKWRL